MTMKRREFLGAGIASAVAVGALPGLRLIEIARARAPEEPVSARQRWGLLVDASKCADGCSDCVNACHEENGVQSTGRPEIDPQWIRKVTVKDRGTGFEQAFPVMCLHCEKPPCVDVCPTGASFRRDDGIVLVDRHICIGCRYCMMACPYKARSFIHHPLTDQKPHAPRGMGCVESCTLCVHRIDRGESETACSAACTAGGHGAILFGDLNDPTSAIAQRLKAEPSTQIRADLNLNTGVRFQGI